MPDPAQEDIVVNARVRVPMAELRFSFSRSSGPGGQNVNKVNTRVTLFFDLEATTALSPAQKVRLRRRLATRIDRYGVMRVVCSRHRTQVANRRAAIDRFAELLRDGLTVQKARRKTGISRAAVLRRRAEKIRRSKVKRLRSARPSADD